MYIESVPNRSSPPAILLRESYRQAGKVRKRTLANLSKWPAEVVEGLRTLLKGGSVISDLSQAFQVQRTRPHGHVAAVLGTLRRIGLERLLATRNSLQRRLVVALIVARILEPRSKLACQQMAAEPTVAAYKGLSVAERAFRSCKSVDLKVRPIYHHLENRVRAHVFLCMLAYYVEWHMRQKLAPILFDDEDPEAGRQLRDSVVAPSQRSPQALRKAHRKRTDEGDPVHSFQTLLSDLATISKNRIQPQLPGSAAFDKITRPTSLQQRALDLLGVRL